jgi:flagellar biosynthesis component FlhA
MYRQHTKKQYKNYSKVYFVTGIIIVVLGALIAIPVLPVGIIFLLIGASLIWASKQYKKWSEEGVTKEIENFVATSEVKGHIKFNDNIKQILIDPDRNPRIVNYSDVLGFELIENGQTIVSKDDSDGFLDRLTNKRESTSSIHMMRIKIIVRDMNNPNAYIHFIDRDTETDSLLYRACYDNAQRILSMLQIATSQRNEVNN